MKENEELSNMQKDVMDRLLWKEIERQSKILSPLTPPLDVWPWDRMGLQPLTRPESKQRVLADEFGKRELTDAELAVLFPEPPREESKHRHIGGTCVDCGHPLDEVCTANIQLPAPPASRLPVAPPSEPADAEFWRRETSYFDEVAQPSPAQPLRRCPSPGCVFSDGPDDGSMCGNCANTDRAYAEPAQPPAPPVDDKTEVCEYSFNTCLRPFCPKVHSPESRSEALGAPQDPVEAKYKSAMDIISALNAPKGTEGSRDWIMSIPARPDYDPDLVIADALYVLREALQTVLDRESATIARYDANLDKLEAEKAVLAAHRDNWIGIAAVEREKNAALEAELSESKAAHGKTLLTLNKAAFETIPKLEADISQLQATIDSREAENGIQQRTIEVWEESYLKEHGNWGDCKFRLALEELQATLNTADGVGIAQVARIALLEGLVKDYRRSHCILTDGSGDNPIALTDWRCHICKAADVLTPKETA